jgi:hypothetical protein
MVTSANLRTEQSVDEARTLMLSILQARHAGADCRRSEARAR